MDSTLLGILLLGLIISVAITSGIVALIRLLCDKKVEQVLRHETIQEGKTYDLLMSLTTMEFLDKLKESLFAYTRGELAMTLHFWNKIVVSRRDRLRRLFNENQDEVANQERLLGEGLKAISIFIMSNFVVKSPRRKRLKKMKPRFESVAIMLERAMLAPKAFFNGGGATELSYEEVRELLTTVLTSAGANKTLRMEAQKLLDELWKNWQKYLELGARKAQLEAEVKLWKNFAEENSEIIMEVLGEYTFCYEGWPEIG